MTIKYDQAVGIFNKAYGMLSKFDFDMPVSWVGSTAINGEGEDVDVLCCCMSDDREKLETLLVDHGFQYEGGLTYPEDEFSSFRKGELNIIVTDNEKFYDMWNRSVEVCKIVKEKFGVFDRDMRVSLHQAIMD